MKSFEITDLGKISEILPSKLFLSGFPKEKDLDTLKDNNISTIINCALNLANTFEKENIFHHNLRLLDADNETIEKHFQSTYDIIENAKGAVLVHCQMGMSRAPTIVIAYLMRKKKMKFEDAYEYVREKRSAAWPNYGFIKKLKKFEKELFPNMEEIEVKNDVVKKKDVSKCCCIL